MNSPMRYDVVRFVLCGFDYVMRRMIYLLGRCRFFVLTRLWGVATSGAGLFAGKIVIRTRKRGDITLGKGVIICAGGIINLAGMAGASILDARKGGKISIGEYSGLTSTIISSKKEVKVGSHVTVGANVRIYDHTTNYEYRRKPTEDGDDSPAAVSIGDDVFIGTNAIILKGTTIGARSLVAAGSVVFGLDIPPDSKVVGNPAKIISTRRTNE